MQDVDPATRWRSNSYVRGGWIAIPNFTSPLAWELTVTKENRPEYEPYQGFRCSQQYRWPFLLATFALLIIAVIEIVALYIGGPISGVIDHYLPYPSRAQSVFERAIGWLHVGRLPFLVVLVLLTSCFAITGFVLNAPAHRYLGGRLSAAIAAPTAFAIALPVVHVFGSFIARIVPRVRIGAVAYETLIGKEAVITAGTAHKGYPAQARVVAEYGQHLYVQVEPETDNLSFGQGSKLRLVRQISGDRFKAALPEYIRKQ